MVYKWFYFIYKLSYGLGIIGYSVMMATFFGLNIVFDSKPQIWIDIGVIIIFYGLYYGVLGRDLAEICADKMASHIGVSFWFYIIRHSILLIILWIGSTFLNFFTNTLLLESLLPICNSIIIHHLSFQDMTI